MRRSLTIAVALFAIGCGALFFIFEDTGDGEHPVFAEVDIATPRTALKRAINGLAAVQRARQALSVENYGDAAAEVRSLERLLTQMVAELAEPTTETANTN